MGGEITVESQYGLGSTFTFRLQLGVLASQAGELENDDLEVVMIKPITRSQLFDTTLQVLDRKNFLGRGSAKKAVFDVAANGLRGGQILLVEDNEINQMVAVEILQNMGLQVTMANDGEEAVQAVASEYFDAVLMDIQMPAWMATRLPELFAASCNTAWSSCR